MLASIKKILYCTDLSQNAAYAFGYAAELARLTDADLHLLHVVEELSSDARVAIDAYILDAEDRRKARTERTAQARAHLEARLEDFWTKQSVVDQAAKDRVKSVEVHESYPAEQILKSSVKLGCDLIVMGAHEKGLSHTFLGGVAKSVLRRSRVPVLVVPLP